MEEVDKGKCDKYQSATEGVYFPKYAFLQQKSPGGFWGYRKLVAMLLLPGKLKIKSELWGHRPTLPSFIVILNQMKIHLLHAWWQVLDGDWGRRTKLSAGLNLCVWEEMWLMSRFCLVPGCVVVQKVRNPTPTHPALCYPDYATNHVSRYHIHIQWLIKRISACMNAAGSILGQITHTHTHTYCSTPTHNSEWKYLFIMGWIWIKANQCKINEKWCNIFRPWLHGLHFQGRPWYSSDKCGLRLKSKCQSQPECAIDLTGLLCPSPSGGKYIDLCFLSFNFWADWHPSLLLDGLGRGTLQRHIISFLFLPCWLCFALL